jgi:hypothetical protein
MDRREFLAGAAALAATAGAAEAGMNGRSLALLGRASSVTPLTNPYDLWASDQTLPGGWFDFSTSGISRSFTTATNTGVSPTDGQTVALAIGSRKADPLGAGLGSELIVNGAFASDLSNWTVNNQGTGTTVWSGGAASMSSDGGTSNRGRIYQAPATASGKLYRYSYTAGGTSTLSKNVGTAFLTADILTGALAQGAATYYINALSSQTFCYFIPAASAVVGDRTIDDVSLKEIPGVAAKQATSSARPTYRSALGGYIDFDGLDDVLTATFPVAFTGDVVWLKSDGTIGELLSQSITTSYALPTDDVKHLVIAQMSASQRASLKAWMLLQPFS